MPSSIALLEGLSAREASEAKEHLRSVAVDYGTELMAEGEDDDTLAWIASGHASIHVGAIEIGVAGAGETLGEGALFGPWVRPYTARAVSPCELVLADRRGYDALRAASHAVAWRIEQAALATSIRWVRSLDEAIAEVATGRVLQFERSSWMVRVSQWLGGVAGTPVRVDAAAALSASPYFQDADPAAVAAIVPQLEGVRWPRDYAILVEGSGADRVHLLVDGEVRVIRHTRAGRGERVATLTPGAVFGMGAAVHGEGHGASVVAHGPATTLSLDAATWARLALSPDVVGSALRLAAIRALTDAFAYGRAQLLRLDGSRRREIHDGIAPLYEVGTPSTVEPPHRDEGPALHIVY